MKLRKAEIIESIYKNTMLSREDIHSVIDMTFEEISKALIANKSVELRGFGTFETRVRKEKNKARNPKTGELVYVKSHKVAAFRAGKELRENLKNS